MKIVNGQMYFEPDEDVIVIIGDKIVRGRLSDAEWEYNGLREMFTIRFVKNRSDAAPTVEPQRKRGNWNKCGDMGVFWQCSECGMIHTTPFSFCPDCGADMRGVVTE